VRDGRLPPSETPRILGAVRADMPTLERSLALAWLRDSLATPQAAATPAPTLRSPWVRLTTATGATVWRWPSASPPPKVLQVVSSPASPVDAVVQYESAHAAAGSELPVRLERRLYRVAKAKGDAYALQPVGEETPLSTTELYLDELAVVPNGNAPVRFAIVEAPLPPGATVDSTTWGIKFPTADKELEGLEIARHQPTRFGYAVPVDGVAGPTRIRHLLRFAQKGVYAVPRARLYRMYLPSAKALEPGAATRRMEVR
jgi:uncharacterized protein YfaS (alpha-2-macroglobulin family)